LDSFLPAYDFRELHEVPVRAPASRIFRAIKVLKPADLRVTGLLLAIRSLPAIFSRTETPFSDERGFGGAKREARADWADPIRLCY
jgi:hypothetical protein